jgi:hypothetical protein
VPTCLSLAGPGVIFLRAGALQASLFLSCCIHVYALLLTMYSEATACIRQLMCTAVSQLSSAQIIPLHHYAYLLYPACLFFLLPLFSQRERRDDVVATLIEIEYISTKYCHVNLRTCALQIVTSHHCTNLLYPAHICILYNNLLLHHWSLSCQEQMHIKEEFATCKQGCRYHTDSIQILLPICCQQQM